MSATTLAEKGMAAVQSRKWAEAIPLLSKAIDQSKSPQWLLSRSQAFMESGDLDKALRDAEYAYCTAVERGNDKSRKQMIEAQHRRSVVYFRRKQFADADVCATWAQELAKGTAVKIADHTSQLIDDKGFYHATNADLDEDKSAKQEGATDHSTFAKISSLMGGSDSKKHPYEKDYQRERAWRTQLIHFLEPLPADDPARKVSAKLVPTKPSLDDRPAAKPKALDPELEAAKTAARQLPKPEPSNGPFRSDFYQSDKSCTASLFMKFASKEEAAKVQVDIQSNLIIITGVPREPSTAYIVPHAAIDPTVSTFRTALMKIELTLVKVQPGKWPSFGREELTKPDASTLPAADGAPAAAATAASQALADATNRKASKPPAYPTSSKSGPKDWDGITKENGEEEDQGVDDFFKKLYGTATDDQKRAMMKSFQESNGTTLSTNWDEVGAGPVPTNPPEGVVAKKWNQS